MSQNVAVAGAGALGKYAVEALLESKAFNVTVLSRSPKPDLEAKGATVKIVDYRYPSQLITALEGCDTLLSFIVDLSSASSGSQYGALAHRNLLTAAVSPRVKLRRFVPSEYANDVARFPNAVGLSAESDKLHFRRYVQEFCPARGIEYTIFCNGILSEFFRPRGDRGGFPDDEGDGPSLVPIDGERRRAKILGNKGDKISFTAASDVAKCLVKLLKVEVGGWDEYTYVSGDRLTWDEAADKLEAAVGAKVERKHLSPAELSDHVESVRKAERSDWMKIMAAELDEIFGNGSEVLPENSKCFAGMKFAKMGDLFAECYGKTARK